MAVAIRQALETAAASIVRTLGLEEHTAIGPDASPWLEEGSTALIVSDSGLIVGEVRHDIANMHGYQVDNIMVAGTRIFSEEYHYSGGFKNPEFPLGTGIKLYSK